MAACWCLPLLIWNADPSAPLPLRKSPGSFPRGYCTHAVPSVCNTYPPPLPWVFLLENSTTFLQDSDFNDLPKM